MPSLNFWLTGNKNLVKYFRAAKKKNRERINNFLYLPAASVVNYSAYLSYLFFLISRRNRMSSSPSLSPKVPSQDGTFSLYKNKEFPPQLLKTKNKYRTNEVVWFWDINAIPSRHREGLVRILNRHRNRVISGIIFSPTQFSYSLAEMSDFFLIKKRSWRRIVEEINVRIGKLSTRGQDIPIFPLKFSLKEKLILRILWRYRNRFITLEEISSYVHGRRSRKNLHACEMVIFEMRKKLKLYTGRSDVLSYMRRFGYKADFKALRDNGLLK